MRFRLQPITQREAFAFIAEHHRHHEEPQGWLFGFAVNDGERVVGVAVVGRPIARMLQNGFTAEVTRVCIIEDLDTVKDGEGNEHAAPIASMLYSTAWRAARALGYHSLWRRQAVFIARHIERRYEHWRNVRLLPELDGNRPNLSLRQVREVAHEGRRRHYVYRLRRMLGETAMTLTPEQLQEQCLACATNSARMAIDLRHTCGMEWTALTDQMPPENVMVMTKIDDDKGVRNEQQLCWHSCLWWTNCSPAAIYVYYAPTHWRLP